MSRIDDLIAELCPDGVAFIALGDAAEITTGSRPSNGALVVGGAFPYMNGGVQATGATPTSNTPGATISIPSRGSVGIIGYQRDPFWCGPLCYRVRSLDGEIATRFLYFYLSSVQASIVALQQTGSIPALNKKELRAVRVPLPPPQVQREIVRLLDAFTELQAELEAELEARRRQYAYYRDLLLRLADADQVRRVPMGELTVAIASGKNKLRGREGKYPVYGSTGLLGYCDHAVYSGEALLVARVGAYAGLVKAVSGDFDVSDNTLVVRPTAEWDVRFAFHQLTKMNLNQYALGGGQPLVTGGFLKRLEISVPPLDEQKRIAGALDKFDSLVNDLSVGLPAELKARRKQYEHYRDRLLTFAEAA